MKRNCWILAGHGGPDSGAVAAIDDLRYTEAELALELRDLVSEALRNAGVTVYNEGRDTPLLRVVNWLKSAVGFSDIVLDLHFNAGPATANGVEALVKVSANTTEKSLAADLCDAIAQLGFRNRGVKDESYTRHGRLGVLNNAGNAVLLEVCFISNPEELRTYLSRKRLIAAAIAKTVLSYAT